MVESASEKRQADMEFKSTQSVKRTHLQYSIGDWSVASACSSSSLRGRAVRRVELVVHNVTEDHNLRSEHDARALNVTLNKCTASRNAKSYERYAPGLLSWMTLEAGTPLLVGLSSYAKMSEESLRDGAAKDIDELVSNRNLHFATN